MQTTSEMQWFKDAVILDYDESLGKALAALRKSKTCVVITKNNEYYGILDDRHIRKIGKDPSLAKAGVEAIRAPSIPLNMEPVDISKLFFTDHFKALPIVQKEKVLGVITRADILRILVESGSIKQGMVSDIMSSPPLYIEENASILQARALIRSGNVKRLIVTKDGLFIGVVSTYDLERLSKPKEKQPFLSERSSYSKQPVSSYMRTDVLTIGPDESIATAARLMADNDISALIVASENKPIGVLTARDIFETLLTNEEQNVWLVGLSDEDKEYAQEIKDICNNALSRINQSFRVGGLTLHVKKYGRKYSIRARVNHGTVTSISDYGWDLKQTVKKVLAEIRKVLGKSKPNRMHAKAGLAESE